MKKKTIIDRILDSGLIAEGSFIIVGVSGGPDSLCLLHALAQISDAFDLTLIPVHVDHGLREESAAEADNVMRMCDRLGFDCSVFEADCGQVADEMGISTEEAGRVLRYEIFDEAAAQAEAGGVPRDKIFIAVAHNADDQSETVLFRLLRGTGPHGLAGIPAARPSEFGYMIIRPLLDVPRSEIEEYIRENRLHPNIDATNSGTDYTRNRIRNELIPYLEKNYNPSIKQVLRRYAELAEMDDAVLGDIAFAAMEESISIDENDGSVTLRITELRDDPPAIVSRTAGFVLQTLGLGPASTYELITAICGLIYSSNPSASIDLPSGFRAYREYDSVIFTDREETVIRPDESIRIRPQVLMIKDFRPEDHFMYAAFDFDLFSEAYPGRAGDIVLRTRREGDFIPMKRGNKKIQDLLVDSKVMKNARNSILMAAIDSEVLWILPSKYFAGEQEREKGRFSPKYHINDRTERVLLIEIADNI